MVKLIHGWVDTGLVEFQVTGAEADSIMLLLKLPLLRKSRKAGLTLHLQPLDLTDADLAETDREGGDDPLEHSDLFECHDADHT